MDNKRKYDRVKVTIKSEVHSDDSMTFSSSVDLSSGGVFIASPEPLDVGSSVSLNLIMPGEIPVNLNGVVKWVRKKEEGIKKCGMGIEFIDATDKELKILKRFIG